MNAAVLKVSSKKKKTRQIETRAWYRIPEWSFLMSCPQHNQGCSSSWWVTAFFQWFFYAISFKSLLSNRVCLQKKDKLFLLILKENLSRALPKNLRLRSIFSINLKNLRTFSSPSTPPSPSCLSSYNTYIFDWLFISACTVCLVKCWLGRILLAPLKLLRWVFTQLHNI